MKKKQEFLTLFSEKKWEDLSTVLKFTGRGASNTKSELHEVLCELSRNEQDFIWSSIVDVFVQRIQKYFAKDETSQSHSESVQDDVLKNEEEKTIMLFESLLGLGILQVQASLSEKKTVSTPSQKLVHFVVLVGGLLREFNDPVHESATILCESWINAEFERSDELLSDTLLAIIEICQKSNAKKVDVKRAWHLSRGLTEVSHRINSGDAEAVNATKELLISCARSSLFLSCEEGAKFLSLIFSLPPLVTPFHLIIKNALPTATKAHCEKYADIYFRAWKNSQGELKKNLEENCLQDLMYLAIHADPLASRLSSNLLIFLHHIHKHKKHLPTASVIYSLYEPFLWRSLKVANGYVRTNAATILCDLFPCTDISFSNEEKDRLMEKQYQAFFALLVDPCHLVRIATLKGVFLILRDFWLLIPAHVIQQMFQIFLKKLIVDASSAEIRRLVIQGMTSLLDCPDAGPFMTSILPNISGAFDDVNSSVRISFIKLLLKVKATRFIKYWKLVPMEHLLNRLAADVSGVRMLITQLIHSSFLSPHLEEKEIVTRCISLIELNRDGARRFYQHASKKLDVETTTRTMLYIWRTLHRYIIRTNAFQGSLSPGGEDGTDSSSNVSSSVSTKKQKRAAMNQSRNKENEAPAMAPGTDDSPKSNSGSKDENEDSSEMPLDNPNIAGGLIDTIVILWTMKAPRLSQSENMKYLEALRTRISRTFPLVWSFFKENDDIAKALLYLSSFLPKSYVPTMVGLCLSRLKLVQEKDVESGDNYVTYVNALCNWNRVDDIMELISDWIDAAFTSSVKSDGRRSAKKAKGVCFEEKQPPKPLVALGFLNHILLHPLNKLSLLESNRKLLVQLCHQMAPVQDFLDRRFMSCDAPLSTICSDRFLSDCWDNYLCVLLLLNHVSRPEPELEEEISSTRSSTARRSTASSAGEDVEPFDTLLIFKEKIRWMGKLLADMDQHSSFDPSFFYSCAARLLKAGLNLIAIGIADEDYLKQYLDFVQNILLKAPLDEGIWCSGLGGISQAQHHWNAYSKGSAHHTPSTSTTFQAFFAVMTSLKEKREDLSSLDQKKLEEFSESISSTFSSLSENSDQMLISLSEMLVKLTLDSIVTHLHARAEMPQIGRVKDLWGEAFVLLSPVHRRTKFAHSFITCLTAEIVAVKRIDFIWAGVWLLSLLWKDSGKASRHSLRCSVQRISEFMEELEPPLTPSGEDLDHPAVRENFETFRKLEEQLESLKSAVE